MSGVTDADRERAEELVISVVECGSPRRAVETVAAALAEEREKARAPFLALADEMESAANSVRQENPREFFVPLGSVNHWADRIRRAAEADA